MKPWLTILGILLTAPLLQARLGETEAQCRDRYGMPIYDETAERRGEKWFVRGGYRIKVVFTPDGIAERISYQTIGGGPGFPSLMTAEIRDGLLAENGTGWTLAKPRNVNPPTPELWSAENGEKLALYLRKTSILEVFTKASQKEHREIPDEDEPSVDLFELRRKRPINAIPLQEAPETDAARKER